VRRGGKEPDRARGAGGCRGVGMHDPLGGRHIFGADASAGRFHRLGAVGGTDTVHLFRGLQRHRGRWCGYRRFGRPELICAKASPECGEDQSEIALGPISLALRSLVLCDGFQQRFTAVRGRVFGSGLASFGAATNCMGFAPVARSHRERYTTHARSTNGGRIDAAS
jgi:hypothetical protein